ncbi:MAG: hypothetical protein OEY16_10140, partial [Alphaproteobacteria bacterium]|nr:hypothetical protein [Alphaproteobacteria bacterium]
GEMRVEPIKEGDEGLCRAVVNGTVEYARWSPAEFSSDALWGMGVLPSSDVVEAAIDIDLDGKANTILRMGYDRGGGCGNHLEHFREWDHTANAPGNSKIAHFLGKTWWGPMSRFKTPERWFSPDFFRFGGKPYMLGKSQFSPQAQVISFWGGDVRKWCEFKLLPEHRIKRFYPIHTGSK